MRLQICLYALGVKCLEKKAGTIFGRSAPMQAEPSVNTKTIWPRIEQPGANLTPDNTLLRWQSIMIFRKRLRIRTVMSGKSGSTFQRMRRYGRIVVSICGNYAWALSSPPS